jgi:microcompartment protein CcmL/EutN
MLKAGNVRLLLSVDLLGKAMVLIGGDTAAVEAALRRGGVRQRVPD